VHQDDALDYGEPDPCAFKLINAVQPLEHAEDLVHILHVEPDAVVFNIINVLIFFSPSAKFYMRSACVTGEFDSIGQKVYEDLPDQRFIGQRGRRVLQDQGNGPSPRRQVCPCSLR